MALSTDEPRLAKDDPGARRLRVLQLTTLFPSPSQPTLGLFVHRRTEALAALCDLTTIMGVGRFPFAEFLPRYAARRNTPTSARIGRIEANYVRFLSVPRFFKGRDATMLASAVERFWGRRELPDVLLAELGYPDGLATLLLAQQWKRPVVVTLRGHDVNDLPNRPDRRRQILRVLHESSALAPVANALADEAVRLGAAPCRVRVITNGVDANCFRPRDMQEARATLGLGDCDALVTSVGHLVERKGHHLLVDALARLRKSTGRDVHLAIVGGPSEEGDATALVREATARCGLERHVHLLGALAPEGVAQAMAAANVVSLASSKEGRPNVVLEALASGRPVVATEVWGTRELIADESRGRLVARDPDALADALAWALSREWSAEALHAATERFSWGASAANLLALMREAVDTFGNS